MTSSTILPPFAVSLELTAHRWAEHLAAQQTSPAKGKRVYLNSLAVFAVSRFLESMGIETDLQAGDSANLALCGLLNATDLVLPGMGNIECLPVLPGEQFLNLTGEFREDLIGYVAVQFAERLDAVQLLGFIKNNQAEELLEQVAIADLLPLDYLIEQLNELEFKKAIEQPSILKEFPLQGTILEELSQRLRNFWEEMAQAGWQTVEAIESLWTAASPTRLGFRSQGGDRPQSSDSEAAISALIFLLQTNSEELILRHTVNLLGEIGTGNSEVIAALTKLLHSTGDPETRWQTAIALGKIAPNHPEAAVRKAKLIDLGMQLGTASVSLIVGLMPKSENEVEVFIQVQPTGDRQVLPPHLKLTILSSEGDTFLEVEARTNSQGIGIDDCIQLRHSFPIGSRFRIRISLENTSVTEDFAI
ncbi:MULTISPECIES: DUF1822 family protein [unclassified Microcoleus]|uniref:DUF1822 family protein n=1 Tax=unclassified Microcoleus TaxID=2642155 RepID=UPI002FD3BD7F